MRLQSIKLSGFKSFAEPTLFQLPGQLVGVVGPNGCGKSNIMDAVRWVLGESKASELRGESMQDVIFNGTTTRKPASRASVELVFDNADHRAGGQWNQYAEIAVKRVLTREGGSSYFINNQTVRRRDVQDVFLGTGLGPRAYAIIGQGTISRIIESRPEELRLFLEEAAGVSKYKERRRETGNRLQDTRENLTRVEDILRELNGNLERLEKQAEVARRYQGLQELGTRRLHQLWFLKREEAATSQGRVQADVEQARAALEGRMAEMRQVEGDVEGIRQAHYAAGDQVNQAQGQLYEATAEVGRLEAEIRHVIDNRDRAARRQIQLAEQMAQWQARREEAEQEAETLAARDLESEEQAAMLEAQVEEQAQQLPELEDALRRAQHKASEYRAAATQVQQQIQVLAAEQRSVGEQRRQQEQRRERLLADRKALAMPETDRLEAQQGQLVSLQQRLASLQEQLAMRQDEQPQHEAQRREAQRQLNDDMRRQADLAARMDALRALQDKVRTEGALAPWLERQGLDGLPQLWTRLQIEEGWEQALEAALRQRMGALEVGRLDTVAAFAADAPPARLSFYALPQPKAPAAAPLPRLVDRLRLHDAGLLALMDTWLQGCYTATTLGEALALRDRLGPGETVYVPTGHAVSAHAVDFHAQGSAQEGMLARAQEIAHLDRELRAQQLILEESRHALVRAEATCTHAGEALTALRRELADTQSAHHALQVEVLRLTQQSEQSRQRGEQIGADLAEVDATLEELQERAVLAEARFEELDMQLADAQERETQFEDRVLEAERRLAAGREQQRTLERAAQEAAFGRRSAQARTAELQRMLATADTQVQALQAEEAQLRQEVEALTAATAQDGLQEALARKLACEQELGARRSAYEDLTARLRASDERRLVLERELEPLRQRITELQLKEQAVRIGVEQFAQSLAEAQTDEAALAASIAEEGVRLQGLQSEIDRLQREIAALGAVNLAAMQELDAATERKRFLDEQSADLLDAIDTLEAAIRKIDGETRELLSSTFETVNGHFGRMFPELFGGGQARLIMTGDEILDAGVQVMAQPPGKKNQTIHLLSGGEKALTAIALVFAIFQLNPAPFCLLDEVDAPLDDANTERYARLVASMGRDTQFLFISHNKIAMEMARQLIGVTMQEQGVSRIVAVDMEAALSMAES
ncbi:chromosome segregation protein SMC [Brachymonas sp. M4Q-1]|uniref:chromosome segregation protein SMC n=1 Tax=Brachymonas sp. M4Q-1 TaxID=3416906 RepID=UPI003CF37997